MIPFRRSTARGKAYLVGAGPGRADLITVRGLQLLHRADVVIYDRLIAQELLDEIRPGAECIFAGKESGRHTLSQEAVNDLLIARVRLGKQVVRLKGGDPFIFGRGGEEAAALAAAGLPFEIVPGISSAIGVPAFAGIPVTQRGVANAFAVVTGHAQAGVSDSADWEALARIPTLVILMGLERIDAIVQHLLAAGRDAQTPTAVISWGTTDRQRVVAAALDELPGALAAAALPAPAVVVVGEVAALREQLAWFGNPGGAAGFVAVQEVSAAQRRIEEAA
ncbi:MAG: uroporphyrinogen-III C-methyltransferase [Caldilineaceae bacterium]|nr:uroporphyrinogen-III C-methyltransferase [Caldilineaceae bacterium]